MKDSKSINLSDIPTALNGALRKVSAYKVFIFFLVVATFYGFILWRINVFSNAPASQEETTAKATPQPRIDADTAEKLESLQDNSVSVESLFSQARENPFHE